MKGDPIWMHALLYVHILCGFGSFVLAPVALATAKGGKTHRRWGMVYLWCMGGVAATAFPMALYRPILFLALVAVFSFYLAFSGWRVLKLKDLVRGGEPKAIDWGAAIFTFVCSACLAGFAAFKPRWVQNFQVVGIIFGIIGMRVAAVELKKFIWKPKEKMFWIYTHLGNFIGSYIAAWSAFSVVTLAPRFHSLGIIIWLWPTIVGTPAITFTIIYYKRKFAPRKAVLAV